jgi:hypothetical protein
MYCSRSLPAIVGVENRHPSLLLHCTSVQHRHIQKRWNESTKAIAVRMMNGNSGYCCACVYLGPRSAIFKTEELNQSTATLLSTGRLLLYPLALKPKALSTVRVDFPLLYHTYCQPIVHVPRPSAELTCKRTVLVHCTVLYCTVLYKLSVGHDRSRVAAVIIVGGKPPLIPPPRAIAIAAV